MPPRWRAALGVPVLPIVASSGKGVLELRQQIIVAPRNAEAAVRPYRPCQFMANCPAVQRIAGSDHP